MKKILLLPGDGIGPEIMEQEPKKCSDAFQTCEKGYIGGAAIDKFGSPFPEITLNFKLKLYKIENNDK